MTAVHSRPTSISNAGGSFRGQTGTSSPKQPYLNGHHVIPSQPMSNGLTTSPSPLVHGPQNGSQRSSVASRSSLSSLQQNGISGSPSGALKRSSPPLGQNGSLTSGYGSASGSDEGLVNIRIKPDAQGRFGFNVKVSIHMNIYLQNQECTRFF